ncbi:helix-turn-helix domain-containing protein [Methylococcus capsulatus]|uniref:helix-turn-helix domain-containing protein n=1 Tax=Methylococcus capsulatus TaxID=414 RepID=UPI001C531880|nr:helix-turn-helix domain-containing protein [Methylococcus capsulatus]
MSGTAPLLPLLWSLEQAGQALGGVSARTVRRLVDDGRLPAVRIPRVGLRVRPEDVRDLIEKSTACADNASARGNVPNREETAQCRNRQNLQKDLTKGRTAHTGGSATSMPAASAFGVLLGFPGRSERKERERRKLSLENGRRRSINKGYGEKSRRRNPLPSPSTT